MREDKSAADFLNSPFEVMRVALAAFHQGSRPLYLVLATELRKLWWDGKSTLLPRVFEAPALLSCSSRPSSTLTDRGDLYTFRERSSVPSIPGGVHGD